jgi:Putative metal-binding motif
MRSWLLVFGALVACGGGKDADDDGFGEDVDCDDEDAAVFPGAAEACDDLDNDCDGETDNVAPGDGTVFYADTDGDGFGDPNATLEACGAPAGYVTDGTDCADQSADAYPGADELCDGLDSDCDPLTADAGVAFEAADGTWTDVTLVFDAGAVDAPVVFPLDEDGTLHVCEGTWFASLPVSASVEIRGEGGPTAVTLDGGGLLPTVVVNGPYSAAVSGLTLSNPGPAALLPEYPDVPIFGGGLACGNGGEVSGSDLLFVAGTISAYYAYAGGGSLLSAYDGCTVTLSDSQLVGGDGVFGGQVYIDGSSATFANTAFLGGSGVIGGSMLVGTYYGLLVGTATTTRGVVTCNNCDFQGNIGDSIGAVVLYLDGDLTMNGGSFRNNTSVNVAGGALGLIGYAGGSLISYDFSGTTQSTTCDELACD